METSLEFISAESAFVALLTEHQKLAAKTRGGAEDVLATLKSGRKFDKITLITDKTSSEVRYFIERSTGKIYGAKSKFAPNLKWYFGTIYKADKWDWSDFHGRPVNDPDVRAIKGYGGYTHYMEV